MYEITTQEAGDQIRLRTAANLLEAISHAVDIANEDVKKSKDHRKLYIVSVVEQKTNDCLVPDNTVATIYRSFQRYEYGSGIKTYHIIKVS